MGYGGPRVEFYTANQYSNFAAAIDRENAARVRSIVHRRKLPGEQEAQRQREEAFRAYERARADEVARVHAEEAEALERRRVKDERAQRRLATKTGMIGGAMPHQRGRDGKLPTVGRNGAVYCAGVDRDRIVPSRPALEGTVPPWRGSYSTHHGPHKLDAQMAKEAAAYYCAHPAPQRSASQQDMRQKTLQSIAAEHSMEAQQDGADVGMADASGEKGRSSAADAEQRHRMGSDNVDDETGSIFSHGSSNGPIVATGNMHLSTTSTKNSVQLHLSRYGGAMTAPRPRRPSKAASENLTLPELADRLVCIQMSKSVVR
ncbi:hypothetical protein CGC21_16615 [Leishmania donovani]|uniref:Uncharacterized protein n=1 Tax=Leishmania donovani TaxID=5661 RepID=A0A504XYV1_LEIDO|nr:hypothetical protein CGC21_16615 [Leishmania donovani]